MADNKIIIEILTDDKGTAKKAQLKQQELQKQVKKTGDQYKETGKQAGNYNKKEKALYQGNLSTAKGFSKMKETMGSGSSGLVGAYATLAANVFAATAAFNALRGAAQVKTLIEGFTFLGNAAGQTSLQIANGLREITNGAISLEESLRASSIALTSGFDTTQIKGLAEVARNASIALGRNLGDSIDRLFRGVAKLEPEILDELGIMVRLDTAVEKYSAKLGKSASALTDFERRQAFLNETLTQGALKYGDLTNAVQPNEFDKLSSAFQNLTEKGLNLINKVLTPFLSILSASASGMIGGLVLFGSTILTTMIPALGQMAEKQTQVAITAREMAQEQANAEKKVAQRAKIGFVRTEGSAALTTKGKDFSAVAALKKDLKSGKANADSFNKALRQVQNTRKRTETIAKKNGKANTEAHIKRMKELNALEAQIEDLQRAEQNRGGSAGVSGFAAGQASGQEAANTRIAMIGGAGAFGGFKEATAAVGEFSTEQKKGYDSWKKGLGKPGMFATIGKKIGMSFGTASIAVRAFGAALMNAIPIIGQILFFGGMLISFLKKFGPEASKADKAMDNLQETLETASDKFKQLEDTNRELAVTLDHLDTSIRGVTIQAMRLKNEIIVLAGVTKEARVNLKEYGEALDNEKLTAWGNITNKISGWASEFGKNLKASVIPALQNMNPLLTMAIQSLIKLGVLEKIETGLAPTDEEQRLKKYQEFRSAIVETVEGIKAEGGEMAEGIFDSFDPAALLDKYRDMTVTIEGVTKPMFTFEQAQRIVNKRIEEATQPLERTSENLKGLQTNLQEVGKVWNQESQKILKVNSYDKVAQSIQTLDASLKQMSEDGLMSNEEMFNALSLEAKAAGLDLANFNITVDSMNASLSTEGAESPFSQILSDTQELSRLANTSQDTVKGYKTEIANLKREAGDTKAFTEFNAKIKEFARTGKLEMRVSDAFDMEMTAAKRAGEINQKIYDNKIAQIDAEYALELFKIKVFKATATEAQQKTLGELEAQIIKQKGNLKDQALKDKDRADEIAHLKKLETLKAAGSSGTLVDRASVAATAMNDEDATMASRIENMRNATEPMRDALKELGPEGELVIAAQMGMLSIADAFTQMTAKGADSADRLQAVGNIINALSSIMAASSRAQIAEIDSQIEAEKKRDGKSKESLAKIQGYEKKKEAMARKAFEQNKKMQIASAIMSTAGAVVGAYNAPPVPGAPWNLALAAMMGALGLAQVAIIKKQQFQGGSSSAASTPSRIEVGKRDNRVNVAQSATAGELSYLRGLKGTGTNANNFTPFGGAAGMRRGYAAGGEGIMVGERGPEVIQASAPIDVIPNNKLGGTSNVNFTINAVDAAGVEEVLVAQRGHIIGMIREAANEHGEEFMEGVNTEAYGGG